MKKCFTLVELLIVLAIICLLLSIIMPLTKGLFKEQTVIGKVDSLIKGLDSEGNTYRHVRLVLPNGNMEEYHAANFYNTLVKGKWYNLKVRMNTITSAVETNDPTK